MFFFFNLDLKALEIKILASVNDEIITTQDLNNELEVIKILNTGKSIDDKTIKKLALENLIDEHVKKNEIKFYNIQSYNSEINSNFQEFIKKINNPKINNTIYQKIIFNKIKLDYQWNELIINIYRKNININTDEIEKKINQLIVTLEEKQKLKEKMILDEKNKKIYTYSKLHLNKIKNKFLIKIY